MIPSIIALVYDADCCQVVYAHELARGACAGGEVVCVEKQRRRAEVCVVCCVLCVVCCVLCVVWCVLCGVWCVVCGVYWKILVE